MVVRIGVQQGEKYNTYLLVDEHGNDQDGDEENNTEDNNDTGLALGPVVALGELVQGVLCASSEGHADGGHCGFRFLREEKGQRGCWRTEWRENVGRVALYM